MKEQRIVSFRSFQRKRKAAVASTSGTAINIVVQYNAALENSGRVKGPEGLRGNHRGGCLCPQRRQVVGSWVNRVRCSRTTTRVQLFFVSFFFLTLVYDSESLEEKSKGEGRLKSDFRKRVRCYTQ